MKQPKNLRWIALHVKMDFRDVLWSMTYNRYGDEDSGRGLGFIVARLNTHPKKE
jgi:hypothetical protein